MRACRQPDKNPGVPTCRYRSRKVRQMIGKGGRSGPKMRSLCEVEVGDATMRSKCCGCSSTVERQLPKLNVASSILVTRFFASFAWQEQTKRFDARIRRHLERAVHSGSRLDERLKCHHAVAPIAVGVGANEEFVSAHIVATHLSFVELPDGAIFQRGNTMQVPQCDTFSVSRESWR